MKRASATGEACQVGRSTYRGWKSLRLRNGLVSLEVVPAIGGRVIQFQLGDHPFLFVNDDLAGRVFPPEENGGGKGGWKNYGGSKLWPAPQGWENDEQWPGPPDPVLDGGAYRAQIVHRERGRVAMRLTSPPDARTGIQLERTISLFAGSTQVRHACLMRNISRRPVRWSIWEVVQHDAADPRDRSRPNPDLWAYCPLNPESVHPEGFVPLYGQVTHPAYRRDAAAGLFALRYEHRVGKVGLDSQAGWLAVLNGRSDHCFVGRFTPVPQADYPDRASVEFWLNGAGEFVLNGVTFTNAHDHHQTPYFLESEILGPLTKLQPGEEQHFLIDWWATRCPGPVVDVTPAGTVHERLTAHRAGTRVRLRGVFGVFHRGRAEAAVHGGDGRMLAVEPLGRADPDRVLRVSSLLRVPAGASRVSVLVRDEDKEIRGVLGHVPLAPPVENSRGLR